MNTGGGHVVGGNMTVHTTTCTFSKVELAFQQIANAVKEAPAALQPAAEATLTSLKTEVEKSEAGKGLAGLLPSAVSAIGSAFGTPVLGALAGPVTKAALREIGVDQS
jgi:tetrahydromethanopterin S-methyltransferase subunit D